MPVTEVKGDLFGSCDSLAHCVSRDFEMGKGIAVIFKKKFGVVDQKLTAGKHVGDVVTVDRQADSSLKSDGNEGTQPTDQSVEDTNQSTEDNSSVEDKNNSISNRYIIHMITKEKYYDKPTYTSLKQCLKKLYTNLKELGINRVSIPRIGCGLDRLEWSKVKPIIEKIFVDVDVTVYVM